VLAALLVMALGVAPARASTPCINEESSIWVNCYDGAGHSDDGAHAVAVSPDGTVVVVSGELTGASSGLDFGTEAMNAQTGARLWVRAYSGPGDGPDQAVAVKFSPDGSRVFVTGSSTGTGTGLDYATQALSASTGAVEWTRRYNGPGNGDDQPAGLAVSADGTRVFVSGTSYGGVSTGNDYATVAYAASTGALEWSRRFAGSGTDTASGIVATSGTVVVGGTTTGGSTGQDYYTIAYSPSTGARLWAARYGSGASNNDQLVAVGASPDSTQIFVTGTIPTSGGHGFSTIAYNASTGAKQWLIHFDNSYFPASFAESLAVDPDGSKVVVVGHDSTATEVVAYDTSTGTRSWSKLLPAPSGAYPLALSVGPNGHNVFLTGTGSGFPDGGLSFSTFQLKASTGAVITAYHWGRSLDDESDAMAPSPDSNFIYVTGQSQSTATGYDFGTVEYQITTNP
jgi:hypothetical protein